MPPDERSPRTNESGPGSRITRRDAIRAAGAGLGGLALAGGSSGAVAATDAPRTPRLSIEDNWLVDPDGNRVVLRGVNVDGPLFADRYDDRTAPEKIHKATSDGWHARTVRLPCERDRIADEADGDVEAYARDYIDPAVEAAEEAGVYLIVDWHAVADWDDPAVGADLEAFWDVVAGRYADREGVLYELFNEPVAPDADDLDTWLDWRERAQPWVDAIRADAPETPIIVGAPRYSQLVKYADDAPFDGEDLVYAVHLYPLHFERMDMDAIAETAANVPVALTEWGYMNEPDLPEHMIGTTSDYGEAMRAWLADNGSVSWTAWCFSRQYEPVMFSEAGTRGWEEDWTLLGGEDYQGAFVKEFLRETRDDDQPGGRPATATGTGTATPETTTGAPGGGPTASTTDESPADPGTPDGTDANGATGVSLPGFGAGTALGSIAGGAALARWLWGDGGS